MKDKYEETEEQRLLEENDISYENVYMSIGIFGIALTVLLVFLLVYYFVKFVSKRCKCCISLKNYLESKLFYNVWIRYMLESFLKMTHNFIFYLAISGSFHDMKKQMNTISRICLLTLYCLWPIFMTCFLFCQRS